MLRRLPAKTATILMAAAMCLTISESAVADASDGCNGDFICAGDGDTKPGESEPGTPGGNAGTAPGCESKGVTVPCTLPEKGSFDPSLGCYRRPVDPQPPLDAPSWFGGTPSTGAVYAVWCPGDNGGLTGQRFLPIPLGQAGPTAEELARRALAKLKVLPPILHLTPGPGRETLVSLPVWLWTDRTPETWGPATQVETETGLSVTLTAQVDRIVWDMGDGTIRECTSPGTAYSRENGASASPDCGHAYQRVSTTEPGGAYTVTATTYWTARWTSTTGRGGTFEFSRTATIGDIRVGELQVLNS